MQRLPAPAPGLTLSSPAVVRRPRSELLLRTAAWLVALGALVQLVRTLDLRGVDTLLGSAGSALSLALAPFAVQLALEAVSWRLLLARLGHFVPWSAALRAGAGAEAVRLALPGGAAAGDALRPVLFRRYAGVPLGDGAAALAARKLCHVATQGALLLLGAAVGAEAYAGVLPGSGGRVLAWLALAAGGSLLLAAGALGFVLLYGGMAGRLERALTQLTGGRLARVLEHRRAAWQSVDGRLGALLGGHPGLLAWNAATALACWLLDAAETWLLLRLLGASVGPGDALAVEAAVSVLRVVAFAVPGGLGIADLGYHALVSGLASEPIAAAFVVAKRTRDVFWTVIGFLARPL
jgi:hypothetical protein